MQGRLELLFIFLVLLQLHISNSAPKRFNFIHCLSDRPKNVLLFGQIKVWLLLVVCLRTDILKQTKTVTWVVEDSFEKAV